MSVESTTRMGRDHLSYFRAAEQLCHCTHVNFFLSFRRKSSDPLTWHVVPLNSSMAFSHDDATPKDVRIVLNVAPRTKLGCGYVADLPARSSNFAYLAFIELLFVFSLIAFAKARTGSLEYSCSSQRKMESRASQACDLAIRYSAAMPSTSATFPSARLCRSWRILRCSSCSWERASGLISFRASRVATTQVPAALPAIRVRAGVRRRSAWASFARSQQAQVIESTELSASASEEKTNRCRWTCQKFPRTLPRLRTRRAIQTRR